MARTGKIARLPDPIRDELNRRLRAGHLGPQILPWLNSLPEVQSVLAEHFAGQPVNPQNLSDWRAGGYREWEDRQDAHHQRLDRIRELSRMSMQLAQANAGSLSEGAASILGGSILELLEQLDSLHSSQSSHTSQPDSARIESLSAAIESLTLAVSRLRKGDHLKETLKLARDQFDQKLREYQDRVAEQKRAIEGAIATAKSGGITAETLQRIEEAAHLL